MKMAQADLLDTVINILGISVNQREVLSGDVYYTMSTIINWMYEDIRDWCTAKSKLTTTRGGASYGDQKIKFLQALAHWATNFILRCKQIVLDDFYTTIMADFIDEAKLDYEYGKMDPDTGKPDKFSHSKWVAQQEMVHT